MAPRSNILSFYCHMEVFSAIFVYIFQTEYGLELMILEPQSADRATAQSFQKRMCICDNYAI